MGVINKGSISELVDTLGANYIIIDIIKLKLIDMKGDCCENQSVG